MIGFFWFKEPMNAIQDRLAILIILGVMGLELGSKIH